MPPPPPLLPPQSSPTGGSTSPPSKSKEKFLSLILKAIIMMLLISFFFLILPLASFLLLLPLLLRHRRHSHRLHHLHPSSGFSSKQLKKLPQFRFSHEMKSVGSDSDSCVICLDGFKKGQWCRSLVGCGHLFHRKCLDGWLIKVAACPICRTRVRFENEHNCNSGPCSRRAEFQGLFDL